MNWTDETRGKIREMRAQGMTTTAIGEAMGTSEASVRGILRRDQPTPAPPASSWTWDIPSSRQCHYILNDGPWRNGRVPAYCNERVFPGSSWCREHHARCFTRVH